MGSLLLSLNGRIEIAHLNKQSTISALERHRASSDCLTQKGRMCVECLDLFEQSGAAAGRLSGLLAIRGDVVELEKHPPQSFEIVIEQTTRQVGRIRLPCCSRLDAVAYAESVKTSFPHGMSLEPGEPVFRVISVEPVEGQ